MEHQSEKKKQFVLVYVTHVLASAKCDVMNVLTTMTPGFFLLEGAKQHTHKIVAFRRDQCPFENSREFCTKYLDDVTMLNSNAPLSSTLRYHVYHSYI